MPPKPRYIIGEKVLCYHGPLLYEAKCLQFETIKGQLHYLVHYNGWNKNWDEWAVESRVLKYTDSNIEKQKDLESKVIKTKRGKNARGSSKKTNANAVSTASNSSNRSTATKAKVSRGKAAKAQPNTIETDSTFFNPFGITIKQEPPDFLDEEDFFMSVTEQSKSDDSKGPTIKIERAKPRKAPARRAPPKKAPPKKAPAKKAPQKKPAAKKPPPKKAVPKKPAPKKPASKKTALKVTKPKVTKARVTKAKVVKPVAVKPKVAKAKVTKPRPSRSKVAVTPESPPVGRTRAVRQKVEPKKPPAPKSKSTAKNIHPEAAEILEEIETITSGIKSSNADDSTTSLVSSIPSMFENDEGIPRTVKPNALLPPQSCVPKYSLDLRITFPDNIISWLRDDYYFLNQQRKILQLPARVTVDQVIANYIKDRVSKRKLKKYQERAIIRKANRVKDFFNAFCGKVVLYKFERPQYAEICAVHKTTKMSHIYSAIHLLRLFTKFDKIMKKKTIRKMNENKLISMMKFIKGFLNFMSVNSSFFSSDDYIVCPLEYHRRAL